jgi:hypothetical protein
MTMLHRPELTAKPDVATALQGVITAAVHFMSTVSGSFAEREQALLTALQEGGRVALEQDLQGIEDALPAEVAVGSDKRIYREHQPGADTYLSLFGNLHVRRRSFREVGVRNGPTMIALELCAGLVEGATPAFAYNVAEGYGLHDIRKHQRVLASNHRHVPPRATLERLAGRLAARVHEQVPAIEPIVRASEKLPPGTRAISIGLDRTSAPMAEPRPEGASRKPRRSRKKPRVRVTPPPIDINYRMAYVGTVTFLDEHGESLAVRRYAAPASSPPEELCARMVADVEVALQQQQPNLLVLTVQDAAPEMWNLVRDAIRRLRRPDCLVYYFEAIDLMHVLGHLSDALGALSDDQTIKKRRIDEWHDQLLARDSAIDSIESELQSRLPTVSGAARSALEDELTYLDNNKDRMRYAGLARRGLPLGSGVTESAAKTVINQRAKGAGQRWKELGLRGVLAVRSIVQSERMPAFWNLFSRSYVANVTCATPLQRRTA